MGALASHGNVVNDHGEEWLMINGESWSIIKVDNGSCTELINSDKAKGDLFHYRPPTPLSLSPAQTLKARPISQNGRVAGRDLPLQSLRWR